MNTSRHKRRWVVALGLLFAAGIFFYRQWDRAEMMKATLEWGRLAPFPSTARNVRFSADGTMFTRALRASFEAPPADIERWLQASPGTREAAVKQTSPTERHFQIRPGGGAQHAEVTVESTGRVRVYVYWS